MARRLEFPANFMTPEEKYAEFPYGNQNPTLLDKRITAIMKEVATIRQELLTAKPGNPDLVMHYNMPAHFHNLGVDIARLLLDYRAYAQSTLEAARKAKAKPRKSRAKSKAVAD